MYMFLILAVSVSSTTSVSLPTPLSVSSSGGSLEITLTIEETVHTTSTGIELVTRALNGTISGPTIRVKPGDTLIVNFMNKLPGQGNAHSNNAFSGPDEANVHFHGFHVSGELPSDDVTYAVLGGESRRYEATLPDYHMPGTHWLHPHRHGSTALQVSGGAALALIVDDDDATIASLPAQVSAAPEVILVIMQMSLSETSSIASSAGDSIWGYTSSVNSFSMVNGEVNPTIPLNGGEWTRFRIVYAAWQSGKLNMEISGCEMKLLAKDGIYVRDFPRTITTAYVVPAGRADIMVRCPDAGTDYSVTKDGSTIATITTNSGDVVSSTELASWTVSYPPYLEDVRNSAASTGCSCSTSAGNGKINGRRFEEGFALHESYVGAVVERSIDFGGHPYHQHVYPYQLISGFSETAYDKLGDWHDTIDGKGVVRHRNVNITGKVMIHCHRLKHEDKGMMTMEMVNGVNATTCTCGSVLRGTNWVIIVVAICCSVLGVVLVAIVVALFVNKKRKGVWTLRCCCCEGEKSGAKFEKGREETNVKDEEEAGKTGGAADNAEVEMEEQEAPTEDV